MNATVEEQKTAKSYPREKNEVIEEMERAFSNFFDFSECEMAIKDQNFDICEAAFQLACDAGDNRFKASLPLKKSVLICETLVTQDASGKNRGDGLITVSEDALLKPSSLSPGKWTINGDCVVFHSNVMQ